MAQKRGKKAKKTLSKGKKLASQKPLKGAGQVYMTYTMNNVSVS